MNRTNIVFHKWRLRMGFTQLAASKKLGISRGSVINYDTGKRCDTEKEIEVPRVVLLACKAVEHDLSPIGLKD